MSQQLKTGDKIQYARKDAGCRTTWRDPRNPNNKSSWDFVGTMEDVPGATVCKPETITAGYDIPLDHCQDLFDEGVVELVAEWRVLQDVPLDVPPTNEVPTENQPPIVELVH